MARMPIFELVFGWVAIASIPGIIALQWRNFLANDYWEEFKKRCDRRKRNVICILSGTHGLPDGTLGEDEGRFHRQDVDQVGWFEERKKEDLEEYNIEFNVVDLRDYKIGGKEIDGEKVAKALREMNPSLVVLAYCHR